MKKKTRSRIERMLKDGSWRKRYEAAISNLPEVDRMQRALEESERLTAADFAIRITPIDPP